VLHNLCFSADNVRMIESWSMGEVSQVSCVGGKGDVNTTMLCPQTLKQGDHFDSVDVGERITL
jgi:hypothetical protein